MNFNIHPMKSTPKDMLPRIAFPLIMGLIVVAAAFGCKDEETSQPAVPDTTTGPPVVRKPNIYLYPETHQSISVRLVFPLGGKIIQSVPDYGAGWLVDVDPDGRINGRYDYLFYEAQVPDRYQYSSGWIIRGDTLSAFFTHVMARAGFTTREIRDFIEYWAPRLSHYPLLEVYPQQVEQLNGLILVDISPVPACRLRLFFVIRPALARQPDLTTPDIQGTGRKGYQFAEWGVILK